MRKPACALALALLVTLAACGGDNTLTLSAMAGTWDATEYVIVDTADHNNTFDVLVRLGISLSTEIRVDGRLILVVDGIPVDTSVATVSGNVVDFNALSYNVALSGNNMTWTSVDTSPFDIDGDGTDEETFERVRWHRN